MSILNWFRKQFRKVFCCRKKRASEKREAKPQPEENLVREVVIPSESPSHCNQQPCELQDAIKLDPVPINCVEIAHSTSSGHKEPGDDDTSDAAQGVSMDTGVFSVQMERALEGADIPEVLLDNLESDSDATDPDDIPDVVKHASEDTDIFSIEMEKVLEDADIPEISLDEWLSELSCPGGTDDVLGDDVVIPDVSEDSSAQSEESIEVVGIPDTILSDEDWEKLMSLLTDSTDAEGDITPADDVEKDRLISVSDDQSDVEQEEDEWDDFMAHRIQQVPAPKKKVEWDPWNPSKEQLAETERRVRWLNAIYEVREAIQKSASSRF